MNNIRFGGCPYCGMQACVAGQCVFKNIPTKHTVIGEDLVYRLRERARIRRQIPGRKSVQEGAADRIADLLEEAAAEIERLRR